MTIHDVAKLAGVSIKTVSRVSNNEASVRQATKDKVNVAIQALNYQPNLSARTLAGSHAYLIAFVYDNPNAYYVINMQHGILSVCRQQGYELLIYPCKADTENIGQQLTELVKGSRLSGLILTPPLSENLQLLAELDSIGACYVKIIAGQDSDQHSPLTVLVDDRHGARQITQYLLELGHRNIAFICGEPSHKSSRERLRGYQEALQSQQITLSEDYVINGQYSFDSGVRDGQSLLALEPSPSAIIACNDEMAAGVLFAARLANIKVPDELSIVGFENSPFSQQTWPKLTTVHQPIAEIAATATQMLIHQKQHKNRTSPHIIKPELVIRQSCEAFNG